MGFHDDASPIHSALSGIAEIQERLEAFVLSLGERIDAIQDLETAGDWKALAADARALGHEADAVGFAPLAEATAELERACTRARDQGPRSAPWVRDSVIALTDVARRVRLGHRGGAY